MGTIAHKIPANQKQEKMFYIYKKEISLRNSQHLLLRSWRHLVSIQEEKLKHENRVNIEKFPSIPTYTLFPIVRLRTGRWFKIQKVCFIGNQLPFIAIFPSESFLSDISVNRSYINNQATKY